MFPNDKGKNYEETVHDINKDLVESVSFATRIPDK